MRGVRKEHVPCECCGVEHDPRFCSQCIAAGCNHKKKNERCLLAQELRATAKIPEVQLRALYVALQAEHKQVVAEAQRLVRILSAIDPKLLERSAARRATVAHAAARRATVAHA